MPGCGQQRAGRDAQFPAQGLTVLIQSPPESQRAAGVLAGSLQFALGNHCSSREIQTSTQEARMKLIVFLKLSFSAYNFAPGPSSCP